MPHESYANPATNDGPGFYSDMPVSELTEHVTRAIKASDVSSTPPVVKTADGVTHETRLTPRPCSTSGSTLRHAQPLGRARRLGPRSIAPDPQAMPDVWVGTRCLGPRS